MKKRQIERAKISNDASIKKIEQLIAEQKERMTQGVSLIKSPFTNCKEAMMLMNYQCQECSEKEVLWNSRPRVTPFTISCKHCDGLMHHVDWHTDRFAPNYEPKTGDRIFVDLSLERYEKIMLERAKQFFEMEGDEYGLKEKYGTPEALAKASTSDWKFGMPDVYEVP